MVKDINIIIPMAGMGSRFRDASNISPQSPLPPKPFIKVKGKYLFEHSISSLNIPGHYYLVTRELSTKYLSIIEDILKKYNIKGTIVNLDNPTTGATDTCYKVKHLIDPNSPLVIANCDQYTPWDSTKFLNFISSPKHDAVVTIYDHLDVEVGKPGKYSYIKVDKNKYAVEFAEKFAISPHALNGIHYWNKSSLFFDSAEELLNSSHSQENFISLTFNFLIKQNYKITYYKMKPHEFISLGTPKEIENNLESLN